MMRKLIQWMRADNRCWICGAKIGSGQTVCDTCATGD